MKYKEIRQMQTADLQSKVNTLRSDLIKTVGAAATGAASKNPGLIRLTKKTIAQIMTELSVRQAK